MTRLAWLCIGICVVLGGIYWATQTGGMRAGVRTLSLAQFDPAMIDKIDVSGQVTAALQQENGHWANEEGVRKVLGAARAMKGRRFVSDRADKQEVYGVAEGQGTQIQLWSKGQLKWSLVIGRPAFGEGHYVKKAREHKDVYVAQGDFAGLLQLFDPGIKSSVPKPTSLESLPPEMRRQLEEAMHKAH